jgi:signal transduction histidine kinase
MAGRNGLGRRLSRAFLLQGLFIAAAAILGVFAARFMIEEVLVKQALREEAEYFWTLYQADRRFPPPATRNLTGYMDGSMRPIPPSLRPLPAGYHSLPTEAEFTTAYVSDRAGAHLVLVFDGESVGKLSLLFGLLPLVGVLIVIYTSAWVAYRMSHRAVSPVIWLARRVRSVEPEAPGRLAQELGQLPADADQEIHDLADALRHYAQRLTAFVDRERNFTRDASHELRSPLTVIKIAADMLLSEQELSAPAKHSVLRIKRNAADMEELVDAFLILARESDTGFSKEAVCVNALIQEELDRAAVLFRDKPVEVVRDATCRLYVNGSDKVLSVMIGNLIRNAFSYTDRGRVEVRVLERMVVIEDSGIGIPAQTLHEVFKPFVRGDHRRRGGHGVGLTIVKYLSDRFGWPIEIQSTPDVGTQVTIRFPAGRCEPLGPPAGP